MTDQATIVRRERIRKDLESIRTLKQSDAFMLYYVRRLSQKRELLAKEFLEEPPAKVDAIQRECLRQKILLLDELLRMPDVDEATARQELKGVEVIDPR